MKYNLKGLINIQNKLLSWRGSEINRNYWSRILADHFPKIIKDNKGTPTTIEFLGRRFYSKGEKATINKERLEKLEQVKTLLEQTKKLQSEEEWAQANKTYYKILDSGLIDWMIEELEDKKTGTVHKEKEGERIA